MPQQFKGGGRQGGAPDAGRKSAVGGIATSCRWKGFRSQWRRRSASIVFSADQTWRHIALNGRRSRWRCCTAMLLATGDARFSTSCIAASPDGKALLPARFCWTGRAGGWRVLALCFVAGTGGIPCRWVWVRMRLVSFLFSAAWASRKLFQKMLLHRCRGAPRQLVFKRVAPRAPHGSLQSRRFRALWPRF